MKTLSRANYELIKYACQITGNFNPKEIMPIIEEDLMMNQIDKIEAYLQWLTDNKLTQGCGNYKKRFAEFKTSQN